MIGGVLKRAGVLALRTAIIPNIIPVKDTCFQ
jgi:hypothetical protein